MIENPWVAPTALLTGSWLHHENNVEQPAVSLKNLQHAKSPLHQQILFAKFKSPVFSAVQISRSLECLHVSSSCMCAYKFTRFQPHKEHCSYIQQRSFKLWSPPVVSSHLVTIKEEHVENSGGSEYWITKLSIFMDTNCVHVGLNKR